MSLMFRFDEFLTADQLVGRIERMLGAWGATFDDIDERVAELGVSSAAWSGYLTVGLAVECYQSERRCGRRGSARERE